MPTLPYWVLVLPGAVWLGTGAVVMSVHWARRWLGPTVTRWRLRRSAWPRLVSRPTTPLLCMWFVVLMVAGMAQGCSTGPRRAGVLGGERALAEPQASPLSVGPMLAVVVPLNGEAVRPAELVGGTVRLNATGRAVNALVFGGFAPKSFSAPAEGGIAGGLGASVELTPGNLLYSVDLGGGMVFGDFGPAACIGLTIQAKM